MRRLALVHMSSAAGDALLAVALADSVLSLQVGEARPKVALYLALTMAPLAVAAPLLVPLLDRAGPRRVVSAGAAAGRAVAATFAATHTTSLLLFPAVFVVLVLSKVHAVAERTRGGLRRERPDAAGGERAARPRGGGLDRAGGGAGRP